MDNVSVEAYFGDSNYLRTDYISKWFAKTRPFLSIESDGLKSELHGGRKTEKVTSRRFLVSIDLCNTMRFCQESPF